MSRATRARAGGNTLRIIGGQWRSRKLPFPDAEGLRPTPDRVRETLFNWVQPLVPGARCLDLFAGSGALGLEALSRGAAQAVFVERERRVLTALAENLERLGAEGAEAIHDDALRWLDRAERRRFDLVFLDPPFRQGMLAPALELLADGWLAPAARIYIESEAESDPLLPEGWENLRTRRAGQVGYHLVATP